MDGDTRRIAVPLDVMGYSAPLGPTSLAPARSYEMPLQFRNPQAPQPAQKPKDAPEPDTAKQDAPKPDQAKPDDKPAEKTPTPRWKKALYAVIGLLVLAVLITAGVLYWLYARQFESTDDAFVDGHISQISAQLSARVIRLAVDDNAEVAAGQVLIELDPRDYQVKLDQARAQRAQVDAQLAQARAQLLIQQANADQAEANVRVTEADLGQAQTDLARYRSVDPKAITRQQLDTSSSTVKSAQAKVDANKQAVAGAQAMIVSQQAMVKAAEANLAAADVTVANAELQLSYVHVTAPQAGRVTKRTVELGNYVNPGQSLLAVVADDVWVTANFKETQLARMKPGQDVRVRVDACPDLDLHAKVNSFQTGSGSVFSSLPAENATGNYVKVVQRVPVKLIFDDRRTADCRLYPGMSVVPRVTVR